MTPNNAIKKAPLAKSKKPVTIMSQMAASRTPAVAGQKKVAALKPAHHAKPKVKQTSNLKGIPKIQYQTRQGKRTQIGV